MTGRGSRQRRIVGDLDAELVGHESGPPVEADGARMIERAGVEPEALDRGGPRHRLGMVHQASPIAPAHEGLRQPEIDDLGLARDSEVDLQEAGIDAVDVGGEGMDAGIVQKRGERVRRDAEAGEPEPRLADPAIDRTVAIGIGTAQTDQLDLVVRHRNGGGTPHLQVRHHGGDLAGRDVGRPVEVEKATRCHATHLAKLPGRVCPARRMPAPRIRCAGGLALAARVMH